jgi:hypothetical protein
MHATTRSPARGRQAVQDALAFAPEFADPPTQDKTQEDMIAEMTVELSNLPRFIAYAKVMQERAQAPRVLKRKIRILNR